MSEQLLLVIGFGGQILFGARFLVQWVCSEIKKENHIPLAFWYFSIGGGISLLTYAILRKDPVFIFGQSLGLIVYVRNLVLINRHARFATVDEKDTTTQRHNDTTT